MSSTFVIVLASTSALKYRAVKEAFSGYAATRGKELVIKTISTSAALLPEQPVRSGAACAKRRIDFVKQKLSTPDYQHLEYDLLIAIENGLEFHEELSLLDHFNDPERAHDVAFVCIADSKDHMYEDKSVAISFPYKYYVQAREVTPKDYPFLPSQEDSDECSGFAETVGKQIEKEYRGIAQKNMLLTSFITSDDWARHPDFGGFSRVEQIKGPLARIRERVEQNE